MYELKLKKKEEEKTSSRQNSDPWPPDQLTRAQTTVLHLLTTIFLNKIVIVSPSTLTIRSVKIKCPKAVPKLIHKSNQIWLKNINKSIIGKAFSPS